MEQNQREEPEVQTYFSDPPLYKQKWFQIALFIAFSPLLVLAFLWLKDQPLFQSKQLTAPVATSSASINEADLPIALNILKNPMVYEWRGSVEGILVAKDEKSMTIEKDSQRITISVDLNLNYTGTSFFTGTKFFDNKADKNLKAKSLTLQEIPIGTRLRGDFFVFSHRRNEMVGSSFMVIAE